MKDRPYYRAQHYMEIMVTATGKTEYAIRKWILRRGMTTCDPETVVTVILSHESKEDETYKSTVNEKDD